MSEYPVNPKDWALVRGLAKAGWRRPVIALDRGGPALGLFVLAIAIPYAHLVGLLDISSINQLGRFVCLAIVALGIDLVWGYTGILSLCQAMFFTIGGYAMGMHLAMHGPLDGEGIPRALFVVTSEVNGFHLPWFWQPFDSLALSLLLVVALPGLLAFAFGYLAFRSRIRGVYFSIITQAATVAVWLLFCRNEMRLCGTNGLTNFTTLAGLDLAQPTTKLLLYLASVATLTAAYLLCRHLTGARFGRLLVAVRDSESRLRFAGYQPVWFKTAIFTLGAVLAGIGGALYAPQNGIITPAKMMAVESLVMIVWVAVGGRGTLMGAIVGALLVNGATSFFTSTWPKGWPFILGALFVAVVLFLPDGLIGQWRRLMARIRR